jgi:hypothetical protein
MEVPWVPWGIFWDELSTGMPSLFYSKVMASFVSWPRRKEWSPTLNKASYILYYKLYIVYNLQVYRKKLLLLHAFATVLESWAKTWHHHTSSKIRQKLQKRPCTMWVMYRQTTLRVVAPFEGGTVSTFSKAEQCQPRRLALAANSLQIL